MEQAIEGRELITLDGPGGPVRGTYHKVQSTGSASQPQIAAEGLTGIVFFNSLSLPRAATGDSAVYWAQSLADCGYPSFRLDLPGLGDSAGDIPAELLNFINAGGYTSVAAGKVKELVERFGLSGVVIVGHCAGTVSAIHAAAVGRAECKGLVLLDPYFHLPQAIRPKVRRGLSDWALRSSIGGILSNIYDLMRSISLLLRDNTLPQNANVSLLSAWKEVAATGLPILLLKAPARKAAGTQPRAGEFDYLKHVLDLAGRNSQVGLVLIDGTDHSFANRLGRAAVGRHTARWLNRYFPLREEIAMGAARSNAEDSDRYSKLHLNCLQP